jgi:hypothetical protein
VYCSGEALPDDHGYKNSYEYEPRPPKAPDPLIDRRLFSICLKACGPQCPWALLPSCLHKCRFLPYNSHIWKRIPRKESAFSVDQSRSGDVAFGLEAEYSWSLIVLLMYLLMVWFLLFGFWVYWLRNHPNDLQNASVPTVLLLTFVNVYWQISGKRMRVS